MNRKLDGIYFRIEREGEWEPICFSDMTQYEMEVVLDGKSVEYIKSLAISLAKTLRRIGDELDISRG